MTEWTAALRLRLGLPIHGAVTSCRTEDGQGVTCQEQLSPQGDHAFECPRGPLRNQKHDELADACADILDEIGAIARREAIVQELSAKMASLTMRKES